MAKQNTSIVQPGEMKLFCYFGEMIPNQVLIQNLSSDRPAQYALHSGPKSWGFYGTIEPGGTASILVNWPTNQARFTNRSASANISVSGNGIFPAQPNAQS